MKFTKESSCLQFKNTNDHSVSFQSHEFKDTEFVDPGPLPPLREIDFAVLPDRLIADLQKSYKHIGEDGELFYKQLIEVDANRRIAILNAEGNFNVFLNYIKFIINIIILQRKERLQ